MPGSPSSRPLFVCGAGLLVLLVAAFVISPERATAQQDSTLPRFPQTSGLTLDEQMLDIARQDEGFGGMFFDQDGRMTMFVQESALAAQNGFSRLAGMSLDVETSFRDHPMMEAALTQRINVLPARYGFAQLYAWNEALKANVLSVPGVVMTDIAEDRNRIRVGVESPEAVARVRQRLTSLGVPSEAVNTELVPAVHQLASVRNRVRPLVGGLQINFGPYVCTLGFLATRAGVPGMVTNSHCTNTQGGGSNTIFYQPLAVDNSYRIGIETRDPVYFTGGACPSGRRCRYSDTAFARIPHPSGPAVATTRGLIAKPVELNSVTLTTGRFRVTSENSTPVLNETVHKVGRTTGWTQGKIVLTCITTNVSGTNITQLCQDVVKAKVAPGDSGSPVFRITHSPSRNDVKLYGLLWGGGTLSGYGTVYVFSSLGSRNIQRAAEMGTLTTCAPGFSC